MKTNNKPLRLSKALSAALGVLMLLGMALPTKAATLSPALDIIAANFTMAKSGLVGTGVYFEAEDFRASLGVDSVGKITVTSLPDSTLGRLQLGSRYVEVGQTISEKNLDSLKFVQYGSGEVAAAFSFTRGSDMYGTEYRCNVYTLMTVNTAPVIDSKSTTEAAVGQADAYSGVAHLGVIRAIDSENDELTFEIMNPPTHGSVKFTDAARGYYEYTSDESYVGKDSFTVRVTDKYGNRSPETKVTLRIGKYDTSEVYSDMDGHWANAAVISCVRSGIVDAAASEDKFYPDEYISRAEFLSLAMKAAGYTGFTISDTGFADDADIPVEYKGCISAAEAFGIISGVESADGMRFYPNNQITRCEAAVIISKLTGISGGAVAVFSDFDAVPAWAQGAMVGLYNAGIIRGTGDGALDAYTPITRGAAAQMLSGIIE